MKRGGALPRRTPLARTGRLPQRSAKTAKTYITRRALVASVLEHRPVCEVPWCARRSTDVHEPLTRARGGSITDPDNTRAVCREHHSEIHTEPAWAYDLAFLTHSWSPRADLPLPDERPLEAS